MGNLSAKRLHGLERSRNGAYVQRNIWEFKGGQSLQKGNGNDSPPCRWGRWRWWENKTKIPFCSQQKLATSSFSTFRHWRTLLGLVKNMPSCGSQEVWGSQPFITWAVNRNVENTEWKVIVQHRVKSRILALGPKQGREHLAKCNRCKISCSIFHNYWVCL